MLPYDDELPERPENIPQILVKLTEDEIDAVSGGLFFNGGISVAAGNLLGSNNISTGGVASGGGGVIVNPPPPPPVTTV